MEKQYRERNQEDGNYIRNNKKCHYGSWGVEPKFWDTMFQSGAWKEKNQNHKRSEKIERIKQTCLSDQ